jgi:hypothetical protein
MGKLTLRAEPFDDGGWRIHADLASDNFSGRGWAWGGPGDLLKFASELTAFPLREPAVLSLGYDELRGDDLMLSVSVRPADSLGHLDVTIEIADQKDPSCRLRAKLLTTYSELDRFVPDLRRVASGSGAEAILSGE